MRGKLRAARASAAARRLRVSFAMGQAGWAVCVITLMPGIIDLTRQSIEAANVGDVLWWLVPLPPGLCLLLLALFPTDARAIRIVCAAVVAAWTGFGAMFISLAGSYPATTGGLEAALCFAAAAALAPTLRCRGDRAMQPRPALRRLWIVVRLFLLVIGVRIAGSNIAGFYFLGWAAAALGAASLLCAALATPRNRGRIHLRLGRLGGRGTEAQEAAAIAALVGGSAPDAALERAARLLRCLPASRLLAADLASSGLGVSTSATGLAAKTDPAAMGEVTAFLSHSWSDEEEAPGAKHALVSRWARRRQEATGEEPTIWLVALAPTPTAPFQSHSHTTCMYAHTSLRAAHRTRRASTRTASTAVARLLARLPRGLPDAARRGRAYVLLTAVVRHGALHVRPE